MPIKLLDDLPFQHDLASLCLPFRLSAEHTFEFAETSAFKVNLSFYHHNKGVLVLHLTTEAQKV